MMEDIALGAFYNYRMRVLPPTLDMREKKSVPLGEKEEVVLGGRYKDKGGYTVTLDAVVPENTPEYRLGYRFAGDNKLIYMPHGETYAGGIVHQDDLVEKVIDD